AQVRSQGLAEEFTGAERAWHETEGHIRSSGQQLLEEVRHGLSELRELLVSLRGEVEPAREELHRLREAVPAVGHDVDGLRTALREVREEVGQVRERPPAREEAAPASPRLAAEPARAGPPHLGVTVDPVVVVTEVEPGSPAARAGLAPGDVIAEVNETPIVQSAQLREAVGGAPPGG